MLLKNEYTTDLEKLAVAKSSRIYQFKMVWNEVSSKAAYTNFLIMLINYLKSRTVFVAM